MTKTQARLALANMIDPQCIGVEFGPDGSMVHKDHFGPEDERRRLRAAEFARLKAVLGGEPFLPPEGGGKRAR